MGRVKPLPLNIMFTCLFKNDYDEFFVLKLCVKAVFTLPGKLENMNAD